MVWSRIDFDAVAVELEIVAVGNKCDVMPSVQRQRDLVVDGNFRSAVVFNVGLQFTAVLTKPKVELASVGGTTRPVFRDARPPWPGASVHPSRDRECIVQSLRILADRGVHLLCRSAEPESGINLATRPDGR